MLQCSLCVNFKLLITLYFLRATRNISFIMYNLIWDINGLLHHKLTPEWVTYIPKIRSIYVLISHICMCMIYIYSYYTEVNIWSQK